jgi:hypothetical protein
MTKSLLLSLAASASLLVGICSTAVAQQPVRPLPKLGGCPLGYYSSGGYCVPSSGGNSRGAIEKREERQLLSAGLLFLWQLLRQQPQ